MKRKIEYAPAYLKRAQKISKHNPHLKETYTAVLQHLTDNPFDPILHTHPLSGNLKGKYACSLAYRLRIVFTLTDDTVHLLDIGSHDEIY